MDSKQENGHYQGWTVICHELMKNNTVAMKRLISYWPSYAYVTKLLSHPTHHLTNEALLGTWLH
jgi:hypothetical protein